jgi:EAL domain-containing protein (putative c-di-GMP-specific phosphodiesterase class I)
LAQPGNAGPLRGIDADELRQALVAGLVYFAHRSYCHLIAEGVESEDEAAALRRLGVEFAQGYLFGRPEPIAGSAYASVELPSRP